MSAELDAARRIIAHLPPDILAALEDWNREADLRPCAEYGHFDCALPAPFTRRCMAEERASLAIIEAQT